MSRIPASCASAAATVVLPTPGQPVMTIVAAAASFAWLMRRFRSASTSSRPMTIGGIGGRSPAGAVVASRCGRAVLHSRTISVTPPIVQSTISISACSPWTVLLFASTQPATSGSHRSTVSASAATAPITAPVMSHFRARSRRTASSCQRSVETEAESYLRRVSGRG
ncbi:MAG: hypothetical protein ACXW4P_26045 [Thermoanaerobaculia bacterium]